MKPGTALLAEPRRARIMEWLQEEGSARVRDLSDAFSVSEPTIRMDLERLEKDGLILREHGGAHLRSMPQPGQSLPLQHLINMEAKRAIGIAAARLVGDRETIILDSGSTATEVAANLTARQELNVITTALNITLQLGALPNCTVHLAGGQFTASSLSVTGEKSAVYFEGIFAEKLFLAAAAISFDSGLTYPSFADIHVRRAMIGAASKIILVADSTKIGRTSFSSLGMVEILSVLVTDKGIRDEDRKEFETRGVEVIVA